MANEAIRGVVLDFGGVMTTCATPERVKEIVEANGLPWRAVMEGFGRYRRNYDIGDISVGEFYERTWRDAGVSVDPAVEREIEEADTSSFLHPNMRTLGWMKELNARGLKLGILTNMPRELAPRFRETFSAFTDLADALVVSSEEHLVKPMPEIYALMERRLGLAPSSLVLVDDSRLNCDGAERAGWRTIVFESNAQAESALGAIVGNKQ